jgi:glycosyltransferase involved in cell wall biosynthesis
VWYHDSWNAAKANAHASTIRGIQDQLDLLVLLTEPDAASARSDLAIPVVAIRNPGPTLGDYGEGIDFDPLRHKLDLRPRRVVMLTRHDRQKDIALALRAWRKSVLSRAGWTLEIYGDGPLRAWNVALSKALRLDGIRFHQHTSNPVAILLDSRALLCSSRHEGFPSSFLESMTVGTPIISVESFPGCTELLSSDCGLVVDCRSAGSLAKALDAFGRLAEVELFEMSSACLRRAQGYEPRPVAEMWIKLLESVAQRRSALS